MMSRGRCVLIAVAGSLAVAGCGGDSASTMSKPAKRPSSSEDGPAPGESTTATNSGAADRSSPRQWTAPPPMTINRSHRFTARVSTTKGAFTIELLPAQGPIATNNFVFLARHGFYDDVPVHRIVAGFMFQTGDPTGTGTGGPGYAITDDPVKLPYKRGTVAMANAGPNTAGSQFFVMHKNSGLPPNYAIFGRVATGLDTIDRIAATPVEDNGQGEISRPTEEVEVKRITIVEQ